MEQRVTILGAGAWGTAIANHLSQNNINTMLWCFESEVAQEIEIKKTNTKYLPDLKLDVKIKATNDLPAAFNFSQFIIEAVPVKHLRDVLNLTKFLATKDHHWIMTSKGLENKTFMLPSEILQDILGYLPSVAILSGPNFAKELMKKSITASVLACKDETLLKQITAYFENEYFKIYPSNDINGVQVGGALKNVYALTLGIMRGQEYSENSIAFVFTKCLEEMAMISERMGGCKETIYGLSGLGDLFLTGNCALSKNFKFGKMLGQGMELNDISKKFPILPEGINSIESLVDFSQKYDIYLPICESTYSFVFEGNSIKNLFYKVK